MKDKQQTNQSSEKKTGRKLSAEFKERRALEKYDKNSILKLFELNKARGVTRRELANFLGVASYTNAKAIVERIGLGYLLSDVLYMKGKKRLTTPLILPEKKEEVQANADSEPIESNQPADVVVIVDSSEAPEVVFGDQTSEDAYKPELGDDEDNLTLESGSEIEATEEVSTTENLPNLVPNVGTVQHVPTNVTEKRRAPQAISHEENEGIPFDMFLSSIFSRGSEDVPPVKYIFANDILSIVDVSILDKIIIQLSQLPSKPIFCFYESDIQRLEDTKTKKDKHYRCAQSILALLAYDSDGNFSQLIEGIRPNNNSFCEYCYQENMTVVSINYHMILKAKIFGCNTFIADFVKKAYPNPFRGKGVLGLDTSIVLSLDQASMMELFSKFETALICDKMVEEASYGGTEMLRYLALYGKAGKSDPSIVQGDQRIIDFYDKNPVDIVYTYDFAFCAFARLKKNVKCKMYKLNGNREKSKYYELLSSKFSTLQNWTNGPLAKKVICLNTKYANADTGRLRLTYDNNIIVKVYSSFTGRSTYIATGSNYAVYKEDFIFITDRERAIVVLVTDEKQGIGVVCFYGSPKAVPKKYNDLFRTK